MKVLLIHEKASHAGSGGVIATMRLHRALQARGINSTLACRVTTEQGDDIVQLPESPRIENMLGKVTWRLGLNDVHCLSTFKLPKFKPFREADVVNIHGWHSNYLNYLALPRLSRARPIVGTLHDMWNFTGHCGYSLDCDRWKTGCGRCPYLDAYPPAARDATAIEWRLKRRAYRRSGMHVVATSQWLCDRVKQSMMQMLPVHVIRHGIDTNAYRPIDPRTAREVLDLPTDRLLVLFAAMALSNRVKGGDLLIEALRRLPESIRANTTLLLMGSQGREIADRAELPAVIFGYVTDIERKALIYSAADIFTIPSRAEVQGLVMLESMACGTPVVGFRVGGIPEPIEPGANGELAEPEDPDSLAESIVRLLEDDSKRETMGQAARTTILERYTIERHVDEYITLFEDVAASRAGTSMAGS